MPTKTRVALFIDAENIHAKHLQDYLEDYRKLALGKPTIARCYGHSESLKQWEKALAQHHIVPMLTPPSADKKNASDFALTIDAVSLLHRDLFDHAVIVSSDADFTQLAMHIREHGKGVNWIGKETVTARFRSAFDQSMIVDEKPAKPAPAKRPAAGSTGAQAAKPSVIDAEIRKKLRAIFDELAAGGKPVTLPRFGKMEIPNYEKGHGKLKIFLEKSGLFEIGANGEVHPKAR